MRRKDREITDKNEIQKIIARSEICYLGLCNGKEPYVVPMNFGYLDDAIYFHCALSGKKLEYIRNNPQVCIAFTSDYKLQLTGEPHLWTTRYRSVIVRGNATILSKTEEKLQGINILLKQYSDKTSEINDKILANVMIIRVKIKEMTGKANW
jgi:nitroimidazol reductase NimA-like FMN-containing flavoprotein (pyridoxamine 5'-phosphate oxidase superfamily)